MFKVPIKVSNLLEVLRANAEDHNMIYVEAMKGYRAEMITKLARMLIKAEKNEDVPHALKLIRPTHHLKEYATAIKMLEMCTDEEVVLDEEQFRQYVENEWHWRKAFLFSNSSYSKKAEIDYAHSFGEDELP